MKNKKKIRYFDLFAGIGGFHLAVKESDDLGVDFEHAGYCEIDSTARKMYSTIYKNSENVEVIIDAKSIKTRKNKKGQKMSNFDLLFAGFPCQSFSNVGYRKGLEDERGQLFFTILDILEFYKPKYFILENVQKLSTINQGGLLNEMREALNQIGRGYTVYLWDLLASDYGLPQKRRRIFFCGVRSDIAKLPILASPPPIELQKTKYPTVWHLLEKETVDQRHYIPEKTRKTVLYKNPKWQGDVNIDNYIARPLTASMSKWHRANQDNYFSDSYIKGENPYLRPKVNIDKEPIRRITPLEGYRLQGFPDYFAEQAKVINLSYSSQYRLIGNAVPVELAKNVINHFFKNIL